MSYSSSKQQHGHGDLQLLQQRVMLARVQELKKQQQLGQFGDVKAQNSLNSLSLLGKQTSAGQIPNTSGGNPLNASHMFAASTMNWTQHNVSLSMQGIPRGSLYSPVQGLIPNPTLQQHDVSLYGTPVASGRGNWGQYSPLQGVSHSHVNMHCVNSEQKTMTRVSPFGNAFQGDKRSVGLGDVHSLDGSSALTQGVQEKGSAGQASFQTLNVGVSPQTSPQVSHVQKNASVLDFNRTHGQSGCTGFLQEQIKETSNSRGSASLDPLEAKILFDTEDSGWDASFSKLAAIGTGEFASSSGHVEHINVLPSIQSGSWSALMQSAVAEASSSDTGIKEELSGLSFQTAELSTDNQPSNFDASEQKHGKWTYNSLHSSSHSPTAPPSSGDLMMSTGFPCFQQTGCRLSEHGVNSISSHSSIIQPPKHPYHSSESQLQLKQSVPVGAVGNPSVDQNNQNLKNKAQVENISLSENCWTSGVTDAFCRQRETGVVMGNSPSPLLMSGRTRDSYEAAQQLVDGDGYLPIVDKRVYPKNNETMGYAHHQLSNSPVAVETSCKRSLKMHENPDCFQGENSSDSHYSKVSRAYAAQLEHAFLNAEDSESSARSNQKSLNQARTNLSADALSKGSPASELSASLDSQCNSELNKAQPPRDHRSATGYGSIASQTEFQELDMPNLSSQCHPSVSQGFTFMSESPSQVVPIPDRFSFQSSVQGDSRYLTLGSGEKGQTWWAPSSFGNAPPSQGASLEQSWSGNFSSLGKSGLETANSNSRALFTAPPYVKNQLDSQHMSNVSVASESMQKVFSRARQPMSSSSPTQDSSMLKTDSSFGHQYSASGAFPSRQPEIISGMYHQHMKPLNLWMNKLSQRDLMGQLGKESSHEQKVPMIQTGDLKVHESTEKSVMLSSDASMHLSGSMYQKGYFKTEETDRSSRGTASTAYDTCSQTEQPHNDVLDSIRQQFNSAISSNIEETNMTKVDFNLSTAVSNLNKQTPEVLGQQSLYEAYTLTSNHADHQFSAASHLVSSSSDNTNTLALSSGVSRSLMGVASSQSALRHLGSLKVPMIGPSYPQGHSNDNNLESDRMRHLPIKGEMQSAWFKPHEYIKSEQMLSLSDSSVLKSVKQSENLQLSGTVPHGNAFDGSGNCDILPSLANQIVTNEQLLPPSLHRTNVKARMGLSRNNKRKTAAYDCLPWHEEVMQNSQGLQNTSVADQEWAKVSNRLIEKGVGEAETHEEMRSTFRVKKRLILTTQLMQQVLRPPPPTVLSSNSTTKYEIVVYPVARLALADACSLTNKTRSEFHMPPENIDMVAECPRIARTTGSLSSSKAAEELVERTKKLESHLDRLESSVSVVDVRLDCHELEKFSVTNHFAKYHSKMIQSAASDSASSSTALASMRPFLQRYVSAVPVPQKLPEGVQCLSL